MTYVQPGPVISFQPTLRDIKLIEWYISAWNSVLCFDVSERWRYVVCLFHWVLRGSRLGVSIH